MIENEEGDAGKHNGVDGEENAGSLNQVESLPVNGSHYQNATKSSEDGRQARKGDPRRFLSRLTVNEWLTALVGVGSLVVSFLTYKNAADTSDLKNAVTNLTTLASEARRQADAMQTQAEATQGQLGQMEAAQRAWLLVDNLSVPQIQQFPAGSGIVAFATYRLRNLGHSPATAIFIKTALILRGLDQFDAKAARDICKPQPAESERLLAEYSDIILPGQSEIIDGIGDAASFDHTIENIDAERDAQHRRGQEVLRQSGLGNAVSEKPSRGWGKLFMVPTLAGCITYKSVGSDVLHETGFAFEAHNGIGTIPVEIGKKGDVFAGRLDIVPSPVGNFAN